MQIHLETSALKQTADIVKTKLKVPGLELGIARINGPWRRLEFFKIAETIRKEIKKFAKIKILCTEPLST